MKGIICFSGKYGAARQYALWLHEETGFPAAALKETPAEEIAAADAVVFVSSIYAGKMRDTGFWKKQGKKLKGKKFLVVSVGLTDGITEEMSAEFVRSWPEELRDSTRRFHVRGKLIQAELKGMDGFIIRSLASHSGNPEMQALAEDHDYMSKENLLPVLDELKKMEFADE